jgi:ABC-type multidrug transport system fused ATPase/permease subunit
MSKNKKGFFYKLGVTLGNYFAGFGLLLFACFFVYLFIDWKFALASLGLSMLFFTLYSFTPASKLSEEDIAKIKEMQKAKEEEEARIRNEEFRRQQEIEVKRLENQARREQELRELEATKSALLSKIENLQNNFDFFALCECVDQIKLLDQEQGTEFGRKILLPLLIENPLNPDIRKITFKGLQQVSVLLATANYNQITTAEVYQTALLILEKHPKEPALRAFALEVGRWHQAPGRLAKSLLGMSTASDEQSILNDIIARTM